MADPIKNWNGDGAMDHVRGRAVQFLTLAALAIKNKAQDLLSVAGTGRSEGKNAGPIERSKPGEPPRKQTGRLRASVTNEIDEKTLTARVGTNVKYGRYLELGTKKGILPRPWLRRALAEEQTKVNDLLHQMGDDK